MTEPDDQSAIIAWAKFLDVYAREWVETFRDDRSSFSPEFWFLLVGVTLAHWRGRPMSVSAACQSMMTGSNSTRETRLKQAVAKGYVQKERDGADGRASIVRPTPKMEEMMREHFGRTLGQAQAALKTATDG